ncbi:MAG: anaerobic ribonucleoside-triphosphate reductase [bacterium]|nr:anaerobic ribonucleoside-triphosphate reductase [bacterium]
MDRNRFIEHLKNYQHQYEFEEKKDNGYAGILVKNKEYNTLTFFTDQAIEEKELVELLRHTHHGKNVEWISRVTGYFSKINSWNKGKKEEFKDRYRVRDIGIGSDITG